MDQCQIAFWKLESMTFCDSHNLYVLCQVSVDRRAENLKGSAVGQEWILSQQIPSHFSLV